MGYSFFGGSFTYNLLYELAPGWQGSRTPGRLFTLTTLVLALLAGAGAAALASRARGRLLSVALPVLLLLAVLGEGLGRAPVLTDPPLRRLPADEPQMHLPSDDYNDFVYMFWSTSGFPEIVNGYSGFTPALQSSLRTELQQFPDAGSVERLRRLGVRTVVLHVDRAAGTPWAAAHLQPVDGLQVHRVVEGQTVRFDLEPVSAEEPP
jgi:hypothetical protein